MARPRLIRGGPRWETPEAPGVAGSYGPAVSKWARRNLGIRLGRWQAYVLEHALRHDRSGDLAARVVLLSTARQNGKSVIVRALYGWLLDEGQTLPPFANWTTLLAAAHDAKQARIIYRGVLRDMQSVPHLKKDSRLTEYYGIERGHLQLDTATSDPGSVRGISAGAIAWDEMLTQRDWDMWEALAPTQSAQRSPIMILTSTAGHADSVILRTFYDRLKRIAAGDEKPDPSFYGAWWESEDPEAGLDWPQIAQANPALGDGRLTRAAIRSEYAILPPASWRRERLNHFVDESVPGAFNPGVWSACRTPRPLSTSDGPYVLAVDIQPGWERATLAVAGVRQDDRIGCEVYRDVRATDKEPISAAQLISLVENFPDIDKVSSIVYDSVSGAAAAFERHAQDSGLPWEEQKPHQVVAACMDVTEMILSARLAVDDPLLDAQIPMTARRPVGQEGGFRFSRHVSPGPIDAVMAMTLAVHGIASAAPMPKIT
jgi:hypothetical protein